MNVTIKLRLAAVAVAALFSAVAAQSSWPCGASGPDLICTKDGGGTLTVSGIGAMKNYIPSATETGDAPWGQVSGVVIGDSVNYVGQYAFKGSVSLNAVTVSALNPPSVGSNAFMGVNLASVILRVPQDSINAYKAADVWKDFGYINPSTVTFDARNGNAPDTRLVSYGDTVAKPEDPFPPMGPAIIVFGGWYKEPEVVNAWDFSTVVTSDITLYAKWGTTLSVSGATSPKLANLAVRQSGRVLRISTPNQAAASRYGVELYSVAGKRQNVSPVYHTDGLITVSLPTLAAGSYILRVGDGKNKLERRVFVR